MELKLNSNFSCSFDAIHDAAIARAGLSDFGDNRYHEGLRVLLQALDEDLRLTEIGQWFAVDTLVSTLASRLFAEAGWKQNPEYRNIRISRPLVIAGLPRTGTTALHKLLAVDPQFQGLELWLSGSPMPRPPRNTWNANPFYQRAERDLEQRKLTMPAFYAAHDTTIDTPDECIEVLRQSFVSNAFTTFGNSSYQTWWWRQDEADSYRRYADVLRLIGLLEPQRRWLLKSPGQHVWGLKWLFEVFPDACVVQTHRDPAKAIPSVCSLSTSRQQLFHGANYKPGAKGAPEAVKWRQALDLSEPIRRRHASQIHDIRHGDFLNDPIGAVQGIYRRFGLELSSQVEARMRHWLDHQPAEQKTGHRYTAETFGLSESGLRDLFADYIERFDLAR
jgi:hypothetical protein